MITHGILACHGSFDLLLHEMKEISKYDSKLIPKKISWNKTKVYDNSNRSKHNLDDLLIQMEELHNE